MTGEAQRERGKWLGAVGLGVLLLCYVAALWNVLRMKHAEQDKDVIRIAHWQLELGVRDGLQEVIRRFEAKKAAEGHPVRIIQIPVIEKAYLQYVTTQMVGGTAPDLIEIHAFPREFFGRYFLPMSKSILAPNPVLREQLDAWKGRDDLTDEERHFQAINTELVDRPWMNCFTDGLRSLYNEELQDYFGVGFSQFTLRMFYNKDLYRRVLGREDAPHSYQQMLDDCARIRDYGREHGEALVPIASSRYQTPIMQGWYLSSVTADLVRRFDLDLDGHCWQEEIIAAMLAGEWSPNDPQYRAGLDLMLQLSEYFPRGFMAMDRMDSSLAFVQGHAAMIASGSWDARSFIKQVEDQPPSNRFEVGVFRLPMLGPDDPQYGEYYDGPVSEASTGTYFGFGITRFTRHEALCIEFLQFATTPECDTILNRYAQWIPSVRGALASDMLKTFEPSYVGYWGQMNFDTGARGKLVTDQQYWPLISGEIDYTNFAKKLMAQLPAEAAIDYSRLRSEQAEALPGARARRSAYLARLAWEPSTSDQEQSIRLLRSWDSLLNFELAQRRMDAEMAATRRKIAASGYEAPFNDAFFGALEREAGE